MALRVFDDDNGYVLLDEADVSVGWIRGRDLGFGYFATEREMLVAARAAYEALAGWVERLGRSRPLTPLTAGILRVVSEGGEAWIFDRTTRVARVVRGVLADSAGNEQLGIELQLPGGVGAVAAIGGAQVVYNAITRATGDEPVPVGSNAGRRTSALRA